MSETTIQCANPDCGTINPLNHQYCEKCHTPLIKRYLWSIGDWIKVYQVGELIEERYLLKYPRILLDTQPNEPTLPPEDIPGEIQTYLKLFPWRIHIPQIYSYIPSPDDQMKLEVWLLEYGSVPLNEEGELRYGENLLPSLTDLWPEASPLRQLNLLGQIARLWQPLASKGVVSSLLDPSLLKINGNVLQLLELRKDPTQVPTLKQLGKVWSSWLEKAHPTLTDYLHSLCSYLEFGNITKPDHLIHLLDQGLQQIGPTYQRHYQIFTTTDTGPTRDHNEDACYPVTEERVEAKDAQEALTIVCDGIGGQEGGEIASSLAIDTLVEQLSKIILTNSPKKNLNHFQEIEQAIRATNNSISQRNDSENRQERQRMGTTLVMGLSYQHQMYLAHVGDSRIYWITPDSCHQVTLDDDLASREVRLGYLLYRDAIQYPNAGALIQALGMSDAVALHPNVQSQILDQDTIFLLCSDGLSDYDRVDQYWESEIAPLFQGETSIETVVQRLIELANEKNGHDNVTVALIYCQVTPPATLEPLEAIDLEQTPFTTDSLSSSLNVTTREYTTTDSASELTSESIPGEITPPLAPSDQNSQISTSSRSPFPLKPLIIVATLILGGLAAFLAWQILSSSESDEPIIVNSPLPSQPPTLATGKILQLNSNLTLTPRNFPNDLTLPSNTILKIINSEDRKNEKWLQLQICDTSLVNTPDPIWVMSTSLPQAAYSLLPSGEGLCQQTIKD